MANNYSLSTTGKRAVISLRCLSHEVCVGVVQAEYWQKVDLKLKLSIGEIFFS